MSQASPIQSQASGIVAEGISTQSGEGSGLILGLAQGTWIKIGVITALMAALFRFNLLRLWDKTNPFYGEANWTHAVAIPFISLYYLYVNRDELLNPKPPGNSESVGRNLWTSALMATGLVMSLLWIWVFAPELMAVSAATVLLLGVGIGAAVWMGRKTSIVKKLEDSSAGWFGGYIMIYGIVLFAYGIYPGQNDFVKDFGMLVTLFGVVTMLAGWERMKIAWFAVAVFICGIPWPGLVYSRIAGPLQQLAANVAVWTLELTGVESSASGTKIMISGHLGVTRTLNVAEACSGLHSLMTFITVGAAVAFLSNRSLWQKLIVTFSAIPIAIFCNVMRICGQGLLDHYWRQDISEGFAHQFVGMVMLIPAFLLILAVGWALDQIFVEEVDRHRRVAPTVIRQQSSAVVAAPVAGASGRSLASSKVAAAAALAAAKPAGNAGALPSVLRAKTTFVTPPPPSSRLAARSPGSRSAPAAGAAKPPTSPVVNPPGKTPPGTNPGKAV